MHSSRLFARRRRTEVVRDILGHANFNVAQNGFGKNWACRGKVNFPSTVPSRHERNDVLIQVSFFRLSEFRISEDWRWFLLMLV